ncbi:MAG: dynamin family protein [Deltaproteobacteria bacterium]
MQTPHKYENLILQEKALIHSLIAEIKTLNWARTEDKLRAIAQNLDNPFSIVFIGEFSTGKSSVINALVGERILPEGITPTTDKITVLRYGDTRGERAEADGSLHISIPKESLRGILIVDTPGTNVTLEQHERITEEFIPRADIVFFVIGAERAVTESEARLIAFIKDDWKKSVVFVINKIDTVENEEEFQRLLGHTGGEIERIFRIKPALIPLSAKLAMRAKTEGNAELMAASGMPALREYIFKTLGEEERIKIKIRDSSALAQSLLGEMEEMLTASLGKISSDTLHIGQFETSLDGMKAEILQNSTQFTEKIRSRLLEFKTKGIEFIDNLIRVENVLSLFRKERIAKEFESQVSLQTMKELERDLDAMVVWAERASKNFMDGSIDFYRKSLLSDSIQEGGTGFASARIQLLDTVRSELEARRRQIDPAILGSNLVDSARGAVASVLGVQIGSLAVGSAVISAFSSLIVDITGILATLAIMATAFAIIPRKRREAMRDFGGKVDGLISELTGSVESQFERDLEGIRMQIQDSLSPLRNFYKIQAKRLEDSQHRVREIEGRLGDILKAVS